MAIMAEVSLTLPHRQTPEPDGSTAVPAQTVAGLARDHARLRAAAELLARAAAVDQPMSPAQLATAVRDFAVQLGG